MTTTQSALGLVPTVHWENGLRLADSGDGLPIDYANARQGQCPKTLPSLAQILQVPI